MASLYIKKLMACFVHLSVYVRAYIFLIFGISRHFNDQDMNMKKINYPDSPSTDICIPTPEQIVRKDLLQQEKDIHPPPVNQKKQLLLCKDV